MSMVKVNDKEVHLKKALPLTLGDWEDLEDMDVTPSSLKNSKFKHLRIFIQFICHKANDQITEQDVRSLTLDQMGEINLSIQSLQNGEKLDIPLSNSSIDSPNTMDGAEIS